MKEYINPLTDNEYFDGILYYSSKVREMSLEDLSSNYMKNIIKLLYLQAGDNTLRIKWMYEFVDLYNELLNTYFTKDMLWRI